MPSKAHDTRMSPWVSGSLNVAVPNTNVLGERCAEKQPKEELRDDGKFMSAAQS